MALIFPSNYSYKKKEVKPLIFPKKGGLELKPEKELPLPTWEEIPTKEFKPVSIREIPTVAKKVGIAIGKFILKTFAPVVMPTYEKLKLGQPLWEAYKTSYKELDVNEKRIEDMVVEKFEDAEKRGASQWELAKIATKSPKSQRTAMMALYFSSPMQVMPNHKIISAPAGKAIERIIPRLKTFLKINPKVKPVKSLYNYLRWTQKSGYIDKNMETGIMDMIKKAGIKKLSTKQVTEIALKAKETISKIIPIIEKLKDVKVSPEIQLAVAKVLPGVVRTIPKVVPPVPKPIPQAIKGVPEAIIPRKVLSPKNLNRWQKRQGSIRVRRNL